MPKSYNSARTLPDTRKTSSRDGRKLSTSLTASKPPSAMATTSAIPMHLTHKRPRPNLPSSRPIFKITGAGKQGQTLLNEGRQYTVAHVGMNGRIYLRPLLRPTRDRHQQPILITPETPPHAGSLQNLSPNEKSNSGGLQGTDAPGDRPSSPQVPSSNASLQSKETNTSPKSNVLDRQTGLRLSEPDNAGLKLDSNEQPGSCTQPVDDACLEARTCPWMTNDLEVVSPHLLDVRIPSWQLGTPRFTMMGTPILRNSSSSRIFEGQPKSLLSLEDYRKSGMTFNRGRTSSRDAFNEPGSDQQVSLQEDNSASDASPFQRENSSLPSQALRDLEPDLFTKLTFKPDCDAPNIVRYSPSGCVVAATPLRILAEITSPSFLDYELVSDFFLTFRSYLSAHDLLHMLMMRLQWALSRNDESGLVVRVRTFVAVRHWILNYFLDDFLADYPLRAHFCRLLNKLVDDLSRETAGRRVQPKILAELKKCWRRICAQYWVDAGLHALASPEDPIAPGTDPIDCPNVNNQFPHQEGPNRSALSTNQWCRRSIILHGDYANVTAMGDPVSAEGRPHTSEEKRIRTAGTEYGAASHQRSSSIDVVSCSVPGIRLNPIGLKTSEITSAHPYQSSEGLSNLDRTERPERARMSRTAALCRKHKRNNSFSDSIREHDMGSWTLPNQGCSAPSPLTGNLVRGTALPPGSALLRTQARGRQPSICRPTVAYNAKLHSSTGDKADGEGALPGNGVRRILGSVRRAWLGRAHGLRSISEDLTRVSPNVTANLTSKATSANPAHLGSGRSREACRPPVRIDMLSAEVAEDFKRATQAVQITSDPENRLATGSPTGLPLQLGQVVHSPARETSAVRGDSPARWPSRSVSNGGKMSRDGASVSPINNAGALPNPLKKAIESMGANLTPPQTPPTLQTGTRPQQEPLPTSELRMAKKLARSPEAIDLLSLETPQPPSLAGSPDDNTHEHLTHKDQGPRSSRRHSATHMSLSQLEGGHLSMRTCHSFSLVEVLQSSSNVKLITLTHSPSLVEKTHDTSGASPHQPARVLRRRPGGNLKIPTTAVRHYPSPTTSRSSRSLDTYTESCESCSLSESRSSLVDKQDCIEADRSKSPTRSGLSIDSTDRLAESDFAAVAHKYSHPIMRPSFETEAQKLAQIPDDEGDCGIESALLKLEGKYDVVAVAGPKPGVLIDRPTQTTKLDPEAVKATVQPSSSLTVLMSASNSITSQGASMAVEDHPASTATRPPLIGSNGLGRQSPYHGANSAVIRQIDIQRASCSTSRSSASFEWVINPSTPEKQRSREIVQGNHPKIDQRIDARGDDQKTTNLPSRDVNYVASAAQKGLPSGTPELTFLEALQITPIVSPRQSAQKRQPWIDKPLPPTPDTIPVVPRRPDVKPQDERSKKEEAAPKDPKADASHLTKYSLHLPFILAFDSDALAQQFTLIEKDSMNEIDWRELIDMNWKNAAKSEIRSWVEFLQKDDAQGVEVVIARFNIMVRWAISELVMTQHIEERAQCVVKLIHIAAHCRRYRNFATVAQLVIALTSSEVARLRKTWSLVAAQDRKTLKDLEGLVTPIRNFHALRSEMEKGVDAGCIPFVGIYTHDLQFNAQRPAETANAPGLPPLVNFERHRTAAAVVKTLLRLLEASTRYTFKPVEGLIERCIWIGALGEDEIKRRSEALEQ